MFDTLFDQNITFFYGLFVIIQSVLNARKRKEERKKKLMKRQNNFHS